jgi:hypothetical protein
MSAVLCRGVSCSAVLCRDVPCIDVPWCVVPCRAVPCVLYCSDGTPPCARSEGSVSATQPDCLSVHSPWAADQALSLGLFPYAARLARVTTLSPELKHVLIFIWAKTVIADPTSIREVRCRAVCYALCYML